MFDLNLGQPTRKGLLAASLFFALVAPAFATSDPVVLTFSTLGDSRQDPQNLDSSVSSATNASTSNVTKCAIPTGTGLSTNPGLTGQDCKWLQNTAAWSRIIRSVQSQKSNLLFFNGDMIMGYGLADVPVTRASKPIIPAPTVANPKPVDVETQTTLTLSDPNSIASIVTSDLVQMYQQYGFWRGMVANLMETGTYVVPVPGNHETQCKRCNKSAQWQNENAWRDNMGDLVLDVTRLNNLLSPTGLSLNSTTWNVSNVPGSADGLVTPQTQLSYSFDVGTNHFVVINTDPAGKDSHAPTAWLDADLYNAVHNTGAQHIFVFGHKPAFYYYYAGAPAQVTAAAPTSPSSLYLADPTAALAFWNVITKYNATYFSGHEHIYNVSQPIDDTHTTGGTAYQVIVGAGGSPFEDASTSTVTPEAPGTVDGTQPTSPVTALATDRLYSWATVSIYKSGKAVMTTYGFDPNLSSPGPLKILGTFTLPTAIVH